MKPVDPPKAHGWRRKEPPVGVPWATICPVITFTVLLAPATALGQLGQNETQDTAPRKPLDWAEVSENWGSDATAPMPWIILAAGVLLLVLGIVLLVRWWRRRHLRSRPWAVFNELATIAGLSLSDRWLLMRIARQQALPTPLTLLLSGRTLRIHARDYAANQPPWRRAAIMQRVASIRRDIFGNMGAHADAVEQSELAPAA